MHKKGIALVFSLIVIAVLTILSSTMISRTVSESNIAQKYIESNQAFWLAEAGISRAIRQLPGTATINESVILAGKQGIYTTTTVPVAGYSARYEITSIASVSNTHRSIRISVEVPQGANPDSITKAVMTTGQLDITGSSQINPSGSYETNSTLDFQTVFGVSEDIVKSAANHLYIDPPTNQQPIDGITWVDLTGDTVASATKYTISSNWSGSGLLIVDGNRNETTKDIEVLKIAGNWYFNGMIWVIGKIKISGTPAITGAIFAESAVDVESTLTGNATVNFDSSAIRNAFDLLDSVFIPDILSWQEI